MKNAYASATTNSNLLSSLPVSMMNTEVTSLPAIAAASGTAGHTTASEQERLIVEQMATVRFIARRIHARVPQHIELEELVSAGTVGLIDAVQKYDGRRDVQFKSYAQFRIRGAILDSLRTLDWSPRDLRRKGRAIEEAGRALTARLGRTPMEEEVASELGLSLDLYQQILGSLKSLEVGSLNEERGEDAGEEELATLPGPATDDPLFQCLQGEMREKLIEVLETLPEKERLVLTLYYYEELTMKEIGLTLGVVESRVSQIHASAVNRLRRTMGVAQKARVARKAVALGN